MQTPKIVPFSDEHLDAAAALLEARHARHREAEPLLPVDVDFRSQIESEWNVDGASGVIAFHNGDAVGYLVARPQSYGHSDAKLTWMFAGVGGHAVEGHAELARDLYARAAAEWAEAGHMRHAIFVPSHGGDLVDAWFRLSFGASGVLAMQETRHLEPIDAGVEVRRSTPADLEAVAALDRVFNESMEPAPSFSPRAALSDQDYVDEWRDTWTDERFVHFVAERDGRIVGELLLYHRPHDLRVPKESIDLVHATTSTELRGSGIGRALTEHAIDWAHANGYPVMTVDWRMTNLWASRFWPKRGFRPTFLRLYRALP